MNPVRTTPTPTVHRLITERYHRPDLRHAYPYSESRPAQPAGVRFSQVNIHTIPVDWNSIDSIEADEKGIALNLRETGWTAQIDASNVTHVLSANNARALAMQLIAAADEATGTKWLADTLPRMGWNPE